MAARDVTGVPNDVRSLYEEHPYPSPKIGEKLIEDVANGLYTVFGEQSLKGWRILDAGCGTGHRLMAVARRYPEANFIGIDMTGASLEVCRGLAREHSLRNVELRQADILEVDIRERFDLVICTGVVVCMKDPQAGVRKLSSLLKDDGVLMLWLYGAEGEYQRMRDRELISFMWDRCGGLDQGICVMNELGIHLDARQYGTDSAYQAGEVCQTSIDVDAFLHPIVNVYSIREAMSLLERCDQMEWAAVNSVNWIGGSELIDLAEAEGTELKRFCQNAEALFNAESMRSRFRALSIQDKLRVIELRRRPTGFTILAGRDGSLESLNARIAGNAVRLK
jgi:SAM-dependent methyltransferase